MDTAFDWLSMAVFAALVLVFLQRSAGPRPDHDRVVHYLPPAVGYALGDTLGNAGYTLIAVVLIAASLAFFWYVIDPLGRKTRA